MGLNPLSAGRSFQTSNVPEEQWRKRVLIPYQQGGLFRLGVSYKLVSGASLNPLSAGRSFQTARDHGKKATVGS